MFLCFSPVISTIFLVCSIGMYVDGICVINVFIYSWIHSPIFTSFAQQIRRPLCVHHDLRCCYLISLRTKMNRGVSSWNISVCFNYNIKSIVTDVEPMLGRRRRATSTQRRNDVASTSHGRYRPNVGPTHVPL